MDKLPEYIKGAIFDLDGTLIDSADVWSQTDRAFLKKRGFDVPDDYCQKVSCMNLMQAAEYTAERFALDEDPDEIAREWRSMVYLKYAHEIMLVDGARDYLLTLKRQGIRMALATAASRELYTAVLTNNGVMELFDVFTSTEEVARTKKHPDIYIYAAGKLNCEVRECAVFEDLPEGIESAKRAGFFVVPCGKKQYVYHTLLADRQ